jgi:alpha-beta hydrolase superfamily lysophospholipase
LPPTTSFNTKHRQIWLNKEDPEVRLYYQECRPSKSQKGTILLIRGFPQSLYQFRHVIEPFAQAGYHAITPDYHGHGFFSHPPGNHGFTKKELAHDIFQLVTTHIGVTEKVHIVGHDIGDTIAHAYVRQFPSHVASVVWGECSLPGTSLFDAIKHTPTL